MHSKSNWLQIKTSIPFPQSQSPPVFHKMSYHQLQTSRDADSIETNPGIYDDMVINVWIRKEQPSRTISQSTSGISYDGSGSNSRMPIQPRTNPGVYDDLEMVTWIRKETPLGTENYVTKNNGGKVHLASKKHFYPSPPSDLFQVQLAPRSRLSTLFPTSQFHRLSTKCLIISCRLHSLLSSQADVPDEIGVTTTSRYKQITICNERLEASSRH